MCLTLDERDDLFRSQRWAVRDAPFPGVKIVTVYAKWRGSWLDWNRAIDMSQIARLRYPEAGLETELQHMQDTILRKATEIDQGLFR